MDGLNLSSPESSLILIVWSLCGVAVVLSILSHVFKLGLPVRDEVESLIQSRQFKKALKSAVSGIGSIPWDWIVNPRFHRFAYRWISTKDDLMNLSADVLKEIEAEEALPDQFREELNTVLMLINESSQVVHSVITGEKMECDLKRWEAMAFAIASSKVRFFQRYAAFFAC